MIDDNATPLAMNASAACRASGAALALALASAEPPPPPEWVQLLPAGPEIAGRDGRAWRLSDPAALVDAFARNGAALPIDWEHAQDVAAPEGREAPAAAWIEAVEARADGVWGRVAWTERGAQSVRNREYRYLSPVFTYRPDTGGIERLLGAALVNRPNLHLRALNTEDHTMDKALLAALGLPETATSVDAITKARELATALNSARTPDLAVYAPRAELDAALNRARAAESELETIRAASLEAEIAALVDGAVKDGKIQPVARDFYVATCREKGGVERVKALFANLPSHFAPTKTERAPEQGAALNAEEHEMARMLGLTSEAYLKARG